ncbi:arylamine n-acetyltransferase [Plakobranchus ocellatus]|uniref:arylamine N-acetyltransferase n=1 Tax=Plakobranchus ocellatus TaxID=259542 RepID=A0AAV4DS61_9GAST|nr:arylamine n-acetyltransferase [Plakobranchus ocellatus]
MPQDMFTPDEALSFVTEKLGVKSAQARMTSDRKNLLDEVVTAVQTELPFSNINLLRVSTESRCRPSLEEIKADIISGVGGLCYNLNVATFFLLKALGYDSVLVHGTCTSSVIFPNNHINVLVSNVEKLGDKFLVETAFGFPTFRAINLNFEKESPVFRDSFLEYKYMKHEGQILRMHRQGDLAPRSNLPEGVLFVLDGWRRFYFCDTSGTTNIEEFYADFDEVRLMQSNFFQLILT